MPETITQLILVTGFFGSGKTTFIKDTIKTAADIKTAAIINDRGSIKISSHKKQFPLFMTAMPVNSHNPSMGSSFIKIINNLIKSDHEYILAETSGMAKPSIINQLINSAEQRNGGKLNFKGMICVIDATRFRKLVSSNIFVYEQAAYADFFVLTKTGLTEAGEMGKIRNTLSLIRPAAPILIWENEPLPFNTIISAIETSNSDRKLRKQDFAPSGGNRPKSTTLIPEAPVTQEKLEAFLNEMSPKTFRIKGFIHVKGKRSWINVETAGETVSLNAVPQKNSLGICLGLTFIWRHPPVPDSEFIGQWTALTGIKGSLIT
ncbi:MAG: GTP-binding protein [Spirochaetaceae bacterium]|jgi:G3E family GTPase|nr:GTP-binding protein [Spirochaetaceae bacterium]